MTKLPKYSKEDLENDTICSRCKGHADVIIPEKVKLCNACFKLFEKGVGIMKKIDCTKWSTKRFNRVMKRLLSKKPLNKEWNR